jgi:hypothetical protein
MKDVRRRLVLHMEKQPINILALICITVKAMFEFGVISRFRQKMLAVKGMVRLTESELAVLFGVQGVPSE